MLSQQHTLMTYPTTNIHENGRLGCGILCKLGKVQHAQPRQLFHMLSLHPPAECFTELWLVSLPFEFRLRRFQCFLERRIV